MTTNTKFVQAQTFQLAGSGVNIGDTTMTLEAFYQLDGSTALTMSDFGVKGFGTNEPGTNEFEEQIVFTGVVQNIDGTATLTGISSVSPIYPYTETSGFMISHAGATPFVVSNTAGFYNLFPAKGNDETITGAWLVPYPTDQDQIANKQYVDDVAIAGAPNATTSVQGLVQVATQAEYDAKTALGSTGASLVAPPDLNRATKYNDYVADSGTSTAYVITPSPAISAYANGQEFTFLAGNANTVSNPTLAVSGLSAITMKNVDGTALGVGQIPVNSIIKVVYQSGSFQVIGLAKTQNTALQYTLNADETVSGFINVEVDLNYQDGAVVYPNGWATAGAGSLSSRVKSMLGVDYSINSAGGLYTLIALNNNYPYLFSSTKRMRIKFVTEGVDVQNGGEKTAFGLGTTNFTNFPDEAAVNEAIKIVYKKATPDTTYFTTANGSTANTQSSTAVTWLSRNMWEIVWVPGTSATVYLNGSPFLTSSLSSLPSGANNMFFGFKTDSNAAAIGISKPIVSIQQ